MYDQNYTFVRSKRKSFTILFGVFWSLQFYWHHHIVSILNTNQSIILNDWTIKIRNLCIYVLITNTHIYIVIMVSNELHLLRDMVAIFSFIISCSFLLFFLRFVVSNFDYVMVMAVVAMMYDAIFSESETKVCEYQYGRHLCAKSQCYLSHYFLFIYTLVFIVIQRTVLVYFCIVVGTYTSIVASNGTKYAICDSQETRTS